MRSLHLGLGLFLAYLVFPFAKRSPRDRIPIQDALLALVAGFCGAYLFLFYREIATRPGQPTTMDVVAAVAGVVLLLEATRRVVGPPLAIIALLMLLYAFAGPHMPDVVAHKGVSLSKAVSHYWLSTEGVFGVALGVSASYIFLFVLFGSLLEKAGAGNYFIKVAFALLGHLRGGPAKAAVVSSGLMGMISGSSVANVVTCGTFTIPLMKRVGYSAEKAGAIEVAAGVDGQIMPPVMGAAAFLMAEYVGVPYAEIVKNAFLPAIISYIALFYIVHLEACKAGISGLPRRPGASPWLRLVGALMTLAGIVIVGNLVYYGLGWLSPLLGGGATVLLMVADGHRLRAAGSPGGGRTRPQRRRSERAGAHAAGAQGDAALGAALPAADRRPGLGADGRRALARSLGVLRDGAADHHPAHAKAADRVLSPPGRAAARSFAPASPTWSTASRPAPAT